MKRLARAASRRVDTLSAAYAPDARALGVLRIAFALYVLLFPVDYTWAARVPAEFFNPPPGLPSLFSEPPSLEALIALQVLRAIAALWLLLGWRTVAASVTLTSILIVGSAIVHSFSKIDHFVLFELAPIALAGAGWGNAFSLDARRRSHRRSTNGFIVLLWGVVVSFALFTASVPKILSDWLSPTHQGSLAFVVKDVAEGVSVGPLAHVLVGLDAGWLWKLLDYATVFAEAWLIFAILVPGLFRAGIALICCFHVGVYLTLGIDFSLYAFVYAVFFCRAPAEWFPEVRTLRARRASVSRTSGSSPGLSRA